MKLFKGIIVLSLLLICNACSENDIINESITGNSKLEIVTTILNTKSLSESPSVTATTEGAPIGAILGNNLPLNSVMGIYVSSKPDGFSQYGNTSSGNLNWRNTSGGWMQVDANNQSVPFKLNSNPAYLFGYYPYNSSVSASASTIPVKAGYTDYMYGKEGAQSSYANKNMVMSHAMSILSFSFRNDGNTGNCMLQGIKLKNLPVNGNMNLITGTITPDASTGEVNLAAYESTSKYNPLTPDGSIGFTAEYSFKTQPIGTVNTSGSTYGEKMGMFHAIVLPSENPGNYQMDIKVDGKIKTISFSAANNSLKWEAGKRYIYNIAMKSDGTFDIYLEGTISNYIEMGTLNEKIGKNYFVINESGLDNIGRPTSSSTKGYSRAFEVAQKDLTGLSWYAASGWNIWGYPQNTGCHSYIENGKSDWRIPTERELELIINELNTGSSKITPMTGSYWSSYSTFIFQLLSSPFNVSYMNGIYSYNWDGKILVTQAQSVRCVRDLIK
ncbi:MAG: fimbrillin family protein [Bacteroidales bacterium]